jgi:hypothetical protein
LCICGASAVPQLIVASPCPTLGRSGRPVCRPGPARSRIWDRGGSVPGCDRTGVSRRMCKRAATEGHRHLGSGPSPLHFHSSEPPGLTGSPGGSEDPAPPRWGRQRRRCGLAPAWWRLDCSSPRSALAASSRGRARRLFLPPLILTQCGIHAYLLRS